MEPNIRKDVQGNIISKTNKNYHISFKENFAEIINVESYKVYNLLNDNNDNLYYEGSDDEFDEDENEGKFDIQKYKPLKIEKRANRDPRGFSKTKCIIL